MDRLLNAAKAFVPILLAAVLAALEEVGVSVDIDWETFAGYAGASALVYLTPNRPLP